MGKYTEMRVKGGLEYAYQWLKSTTRKPSPYQQRLLTMYQTPCQDYLFHFINNFINASQKDLFFDIHRYEEDLARHCWAKAARDPRAQQLQQEMVKLRKVHYYAKYGDYARRVAHALRDATWGQQIENWNKISGQYKWSDISTQLYRGKSTGTYMDPA